MDWLLHGATYSNYALEAALISPQSISSASFSTQGFAISLQKQLIDLRHCDGMEGDMQAYGGTLYYL